MIETGSARLFSKNAYAGNTYIQTTQLLNIKSMRIKVNEKTIVIFKGATARDALLRYFARCDIDRSLVKQAVIYDKWGHTIGHDSPLSDNQEITFSTNPENTEDSD